jgi:glycosyltransferase involved in cell wall biosynthesis
MTMPEVRFSVIIPNYNNAATICAAIDSVLAQRYRAHEIIVIDDGSTDDSRAVVARYGAQVRYVYQNNAGVALARNHGARLATGNWLAFLDADDLFLPARLEAHASWLAREPDLDFLLGDQENRTPDGALIAMAIGASAAGRALLARAPGQAEVTLEAADFGALIADGFGEIRTLSLPTATFAALGGFPAGVKIGEDLHLVVRLLARSRKAGVVTAPLAIYYIYPNSALRANVLGAQIAFVATLVALQREMVAAAAPAPIRTGCRDKLRSARLSLAYTYLRQQRRWDALRSIAPAALAQPGWRTLRDVLSVARGL